MRNVKIWDPPKKRVLKFCDPAADSLVPPAIVDYVSLMWIKQQLVKFWNKFLFSIINAESLPYRIFTIA